MYIPGFLVLLKIFNSSIISLDGISHDGILKCGRILVKFNAANSIQPLKIHVTFPSTADSVEDERRPDMDLEVRVAIS